jgi:hypothetical protein
MARIGEEIGEGSTRRITKLYLNTVAMRIFVAMSAESTAKPKFSAIYSPFAEILKP